MFSLFIDKYLENPFLNGIVERAILNSRGYPRELLRGYSADHKNDLFSSFI